VYLIAPSGDKARAPESLEKLQGGKDGDDDQDHESQVIGV
jgi:hypothetical protein